MPVSSEYPLRALLQLREEIKRHGERRLAEAVQALRAAEEARTKARTMTEAARAQFEDQQRFFYRTGPTRAGELQGAERHLRRLVAELGEAGEAERQAQATCRERAVTLQTERERLARAEADLQVVVRNQEAWIARGEVELRRAEEELEDLVASRPKRR